MRIRLNKELGYFARKILHIILNLTCGVLALVVSPDWVKPLTVLAFVLVLIFESIRLKTQAKRLVHQTVGALFKKEEAIDYSGMFWAAIGAMMVVLFAEPVALAYSLFVLALADPLASFAGKYFRKKPFYMKKSWPGSLTCFIVASLVTWAFVFFIPISAPFILFPLFMGLVVSVLEAFSFPFDDNFLIIVVSSYLMNLML